MVYRITLVSVLILSFQFLLGCGKASVLDATNVKVVIQQHKLIDIVKTKYPKLYKDIAVVGISPNDAVLLFVVNKGGTYVYRRGKEQKLEAVHHAKVILPSSITRISYEEGVFMLWSADKLQLTLGDYR